jgi:hypothetical protein
MALAFCPIGGVISVSTPKALFAVSSANPELPQILKLSPTAGSDDLKQTGLHQGAKV